MFIALDLETTGFNPSEDSIIEFGAVKFDLNGKTETLQFLVNPGFKIPQIITHITKIKNTDLESAKPLAEHLEEIKNFLGDLPIIGHNIRFDTTFLRSNGIEINNEEYDTQELTSILLPDMPSYSLEILTKILDLPHEEKHRALNDATASMELFCYLLVEIKNLKPGLLNRIQDLCQKTSWPLKKIFLDINNLQINYKSKKTATKKPKPTTEKETPEINSFLETTTEEILIKTGSALFEYNHPYYTLIKKLLSKARPDTYISVAHKIFNDLSNEIPNTIAKIDTPKNYLSLKRLEKFSRQKHFENHEITSLLKYLIFSQNTTTGLITEVKLFNEERTTIHKINIDENIDHPEEEHFFKKALEKDKNSATLCTHQYIIDNFLQKNSSNLLLKNSKLIIINLENFSNQLHKKNSIYIKLGLLTEPLNELTYLHSENQNIKDLINKSIILFGLIGIIFEKDYVEDDFMRRASINPATLSSKEWQEAKFTLNNLIQESHKLAEIKNKNTKGYLKQWKEKLKQLHQIFFTPELNKNFIWIEQDREENIIVRKLPCSTKQELNQILSEYKKYTIIDQNLSSSDKGKFIKTLYGLSEELPLIREKKTTGNLSIIVCNDINDSDKNQLPDFLSRYYKKNDETIAIIFTSKKILQFFTLSLAEKNIPTIAQLSGSIGKIQEQFLQFLDNSENPILLLTPNTWEYFEPSGKIDTIFIHKLPFIPPSNPELIALSQNYQNPFSELQVPLATYTLKKLITKLGQNCQKPKKAIILDSRIMTKFYGKEIIKNLSIIKTPELTKLETLIG